MAGALKQTFIEAVRLTPDGIQDFLETPIPTPPEISTPADVDAAIIASGVLSKYLLDVFTVFAGLTPVELLLRIGQHNSVLESAMIAGLEYIEGADSEEQDLTFTEPSAGQSYTPGEMRFTVSAKNGTPARVMLTVDSGDPLKMTSDDGKIWTQYQTIIATGEHSAEASAEFAAGDVKNASVTFSIEEYDPENPPDPPPEEPPEPPGGGDLEALKRLQNQALVAYRALLSFGNLGDPDEYKSRMAAFTSAVSQFLAAVTQTDAATYKQRINELLSEITTILNRSPLTTTDLEEATNAASKIVNNMNAIMSVVQ